MSVAVEPRTLNYIAQHCGGEIFAADPERVVRRVGTDSRRAQPDDLFFALVGDRFDGHAFLREVCAKGIAGAVVEREKMAQRMGEALPAPLIVVADTRRALGRLAAQFRTEFDLPVIAVGGSNGKTTTKEILAAVLRQKFRTLWSEASFNNDIGVPLTLLCLERAHEAAVLEAGTNHPGELEPLVRMIRPQFGVITSLGHEHLEFFDSLAGVAEEQAALARSLPVNGKLFLNGDSPEVESIIESTAVEVVRVGFSEGNDWRARDLRQDEAGLSFQVEGSDAAFGGEYRVHLLGRHQAVNALFGIAVGKELGLDRAAIQRGLLDCQPPRMRMQLWSLGGVRFLDDAYNANEDSMRAALQTLRDFPTPGRRVAVLGDMAELGRHAEAAHAQVGRAAAAARLDHLFVVGKMAPVTARAARDAGLGAVTERPDVEGAAAALQYFLREGDVVLLKASRAARFERLGEWLRLAKNRPGPTPDPTPDEQARCSSI